MFGFKSKKGEVLNHWVGFVEGLNLSPQEFYTEFEKQLEARKIPSMERHRVEFAEGGLLSDKRLYLRMIRERLSIDACAAPFGNMFFFSCRSVYFPPIIRLWHILVLLMLFGAVYSVLVKPLGIQYAAIAVVTLLLALAQVFRNAVALQLSNVDVFLTKLPVIGSVYECWFRKDTYYRQDTRLLYLEAVPKIFRELAEEAVAAKGVKLTRQFQNAPILGDLYKPLPPAVTPEKA